MSYGAISAPRMLHKGFTLRNVSVQNILWRLKQLHFKGTLIQFDLLILHIVTFGYAATWSHTCIDISLHHWPVWKVLYVIKNTIWNALQYSARRYPSYDDCLYSDGRHIENLYRLDIDYFPGEIIGKIFPHLLDKNVTIITVYLLHYKQKSHTFLRI